MLLATIAALMTSTGRDRQPNCEAVADQENGKGELYPLWCWYCVRFRRRAAYFTCRDLAESYDDSSIIRGQERLRSLQELLCSFCREYHELETTRNFRQTIFYSDSGHGSYVILLHRF